MVRRKKTSIDEGHLRTGDKDNVDITYTDDRVPVKVTVEFADGGEEVTEIDSRYGYCFFWYNNDEETGTGGGYGAIMGFTMAAINSFKTFREFLEDREADERGG